MIILRQKEFTRAEKRLVKKIWKQTNGLRQLPNGITNVEDAKALRDLSGQLNKGGEIVVTPEIRTMLDNMGLQEATPELLNKISKKYRNPELDKRFERLLKYKRQKYFRVFDPLSVYKSRDLKTGEHVAKKSRKDWKEYLNKLDTQHSIEDVQQGKAIGRYYRKKKGSTVISNEDTSISKLNNKIKGANLSNFDYKLANTQPNQMKEVAKFNASPTGEIIAVKSDSPGSIVAHEIGHNKAFRESGTIPEVEGRIDNTYGYRRALENLKTVADENIASAHALDILRNQPSIGRYREDLNNSMGTYLSGARAEIIPSKYSRQYINAPIRTYDQLTGRL